MSVRYAYQATLRTNQADDGYELYLLVSASLHDQVGYILIFYHLNTIYCLYTTLYAASIPTFEYSGYNSSG